MTDSVASVHFNVQGRVHADLSLETNDGVRRWRLSCSSGIQFAYLSYYDDLPAAWDAAIEGISNAWGNLTAEWKRRSEQALNDRKLQSAADAELQEFLESQGLQ